MLFFDQCIYDILTSPEIKEEKEQAKEEPKEKYIFSFSENELNEILRLTLAPMRRISVFYAVLAIALTLLFQILKVSSETNDSILFINNM